ncbi:MAG: diguanylate cyclase [Cyanobacteria bacterium P01_A01_bin.3]
MNWSTDPGQLLSTSEAGASALGIVTNKLTVSGSSQSGASQSSAQSTTLPSPSPSEDTPSTLAVAEEVDSDVLVFVDEDTDALATPSVSDRPSWKVLVVDDEEQVHAVTRLALRKFAFDGRPIQLISAYSEEEAKAILARTPDIAVLLLDVVMDTDKSGLEVVKYARETLHNYLLRIVLRTGQPGIAPETSVINAYDINDYRNKTELTQQKLFSVTITSLRAYKGMLNVDESRREIEALNRKLKHINENLEELVTARTRELEAKNQLLLREIQFRTLAQEELEEANRALDRVNSQLEFLATHDELTRVANRRHFNQVLEKTWHVARRQRSTVSLILCDIDYFKQYNDTYGHIQGDVCLQQVAAVFGKVLKRPADLAARYGGEEFAIVLPDTDVEGAMIVARAAQQKIAALAIAHRESQVSEQVTLSFGVASAVPDTEDGVRVLIGQADKALYQSKADGRNCITAATPVG